MLSDIRSSGVVLNQCIPRQIVPLMSVIIANFSLCSERNRWWLRHTRLAGQRAAALSATQVNQPSTQPASNYLGRSVAVEISERWRSKMVEGQGE